MRLLIVSHYFEEHGGGIEIVAGKLARLLARRGVQVTWLAADEPGLSPVPGIERRPLKNWDPLGPRGIPYPFFGLAALRRVWRAVGESDAVHIHESTYLSSLFAFACAKWRRVPVLVTQHIGWLPFSSIWLRAILKGLYATVGRTILQGAEAVVFLNERVQSYFAGLVPFARPPRIIANGVDQALFRPLAETARRRQREALSIPDAAIAVLFVGRFVEKKGLHALRELAARHPDLRWYFIGSGPRDPRGWALGNVTTVGRLPQAEIIPWYQAADLLVLPSRGEGFPLVVQESMACGTPVLVSDEIASSVPGLGAVAYSAAPDTESLTNALAGILAEPDRLRQRRAEVEAFARRNWDWEQCADAYLELLAGLKGEPWKEPRTKNASSIKRSI